MWLRRDIAVLPFLRKASALARVSDRSICVRWVRLTGVRKGFYVKSGRSDSNRRRPAWEAGILPLNYARNFLSPGVEGPPLREGELLPGRPNFKQHHSPAPTRRQPLSGFIGPCPLLASPPAGGPLSPTLGKRHSGVTDGP